MRHCRSLIYEGSKLEHSNLLSTVVLKDKLDLRIVQGIWLGPWSKVPIEQLEFIENKKIYPLPLEFPAN